MRVLQMGRLGAGHIPVLFAIIFTINLGATYVFAVWHGDVDPVFPYISASGNSRPESCLFGMFLNICSFMSMLIIYLSSLYVGLIGATGMFIVANFQESAVITIHLIGAVSCFGVGTVYMFAQSWITYRMCPLFCSRRIGHIRTALAIGSVVFFLLALGFGIAASKTFHKYHPDKPTPRPWSRKDHQEGYTLHCVSSVAEWLMAALHVCFLLSYSRDFEKIRVELGVQPLVSHLDQSPIWQSLSDLSASP